MAAPNEFKLFPKDHLSGLVTALDGALCEGLQFAVGQAGEERDIGERVFDQMPIIYEWSPARGIGP